MISDYEELARKRKAGEPLGNYRLPSGFGNMDAQVTCLSLDCPERKSVCCNAISTYTHTGKGYFACSNCGKEFQGGECTAGKDTYV